MSDRSKSRTKIRHSWIKEYWTKSKYTLSSNAYNINLLHGKNIVELVWHQKHVRQNPFKAFFAVAFLKGKTSLHSWYVSHGALAECSKHEELSRNMKHSLVCFELQNFERFCFYFLCISLSDFKIRRKCDRFRIAITKTWWTGMVKWLVWSSLGGQVEEVFGFFTSLSIIFLHRKIQSLRFAVGTLVILILILVAECDIRKHFGTSECPNIFLSKHCS